MGKTMGTFLEEVNKRIDGVPIERCYHCRKCTAGCPTAFAMEQIGRASCRERVYVLV